MGDMLSKGVQSINVDGVHDSENEFSSEGYYTKGDRSAQVSPWSSEIFLS